MTKDTKKDDALTALTSQEEVTTPAGVKILVQGLGIKEVKKFSNAISRVIPAIMPIIMNQSGVSADWAKAITAAVLPFAMADLLELVDDCIDVTLEKVPLHHVPPIVEKWVEMSFGDPKKLMPWVEMAKGISDRFIQAKATQTSQT